VSPVWAAMLEHLSRCVGFNLHSDLCKTNAPKTTADQRPIMSDIDRVGIVIYSVTGSDLYDRGFPPARDDITFPTVTTPHTFASSCGNHWVQHAPDHQVLSSTIVGGRSAGGGSAAGKYFMECFPGSTNTFSLGVCPSGHDLATIVEHTKISGVGDDRLWEAYCCGR
jgi:hypothetical protein